MVWAKLLPVLPQIVPSVLDSIDQIFLTIRYIRFSVSQGIFHTNKVMAQASAIALMGPLKGCETNLAAESYSRVFVNWAISENFWQD